MQQVYRFKTSSLRYFSSSINVTTTSIPFVYTESRFNPDLNLVQCKLQSKYLFNLSPKYVLPAEFRHSLPNQGLAEFAFVGRSNAGKSSLINCLLGGGKNLVRISKEAGCTKSVNFFALCKDKGIGLNKHAAYLVDLPGYGFAKKSRKDQEDWMRIINDYFATRSASILRRVFVLIDSRRGVMDSDLVMMLTLNCANLPYQIIFTKGDLITESILAENLHLTFEALFSQRGNSTCFPYIHVVSSTTKSGIDELKLAIGGIYGNKNKDVIKGDVVDKAKA